VSIIPTPRITKMEKFYPIARQYATVGFVAITLGYSVPASYDKNPESYLYVLLLVFILLSLWGASLGLIPPRLVLSSHLSLSLFVSVSLSLYLSPSPALAQENLKSIA
jgi:hypothetical protein